ncbi:homologous-pairing protein 2 homolog [Galleria mellonella]|uniref:Homologous-pairing protein 2 homolog n=1 Tax=Galleria mellonella TaxID=7137 RepID=A0ABM3N686_GALME|nr:homologous-pairing protein 2 homolog [Galleria mellonella]
MAGEAVLKYLTDTNRPYSCADVTTNLRGTYTKTAVQKALDSLAEVGKIKCKLYGKQKVYAAIQLDNTDGDSDIEDYDNQLKNLMQSITDSTNTLKTAEINLKNLTSAPTTEAAINEIEEIKKRLENHEIKLNNLRSSTEIINPVEKNKILNDFDKFFKEYRKRKRICNDMLEAILEGYPKSKKTLLEELCIETDEMVNFKIVTNSY